MPSDRSLRIAVITILGLLLPAAGSAYTIVFRDESTLVALRKYEIRDGQALVTLPSGTQTTFPLGEIDVDKTEKINQLGVKRGILLNRPDTQVLRRANQQESQTIADLVRLHQLAKPVSLGQKDISEIRRTQAGNLDLFTLGRNIPSSENEAAVVREHLEEIGLRLFRIFAGTRESRLLLDFTTNTDTEVFAALLASAAALSETRQLYPSLEALELIMSTSSRTRAAQFVLRPPAAEMLIQGVVSPADFFLQNVQF